MISPLGWGLDDLATVIAMCRLESREAEALADAAGGDRESALRLRAARYRLIADTLNTYRLSCRQPVQYLRQPKQPGPVATRAQELTCEALWRFAAHLGVPIAGVADKVVDAARLQMVGDALADISAAYGYLVADIQ